MKIWLSSLVVGLAGLFALQALATTPDCDGEMSTPALRFVRLIPSALANGTVTLQSLRWMIEQPKPSNPVWGARRPENLAQKNSFQREILRINPTQWQLIVKRAIEIEREHMKGLGLIEDAKDSTKSIFSIRPVFTFPRSEGVIQHFTSSRGEIFVCTRSPDHSHVHNLTAGTKFRIDKQTADYNANDFFETSSGDILFTLLSEGQLTVHNARTGQRLVDVDLSAYPMADRLMPLMYEENEVPTVVMGMNNVHVTEAEALIALHKVRIVAGEPHPEVVPFEPNIQVTRLKDGHLYHYTSQSNKESDDSNPSEDIVLRDLSLNKEVLRLTGVKGDDFAARPALIDSHGPRFIYQPVKDSNIRWSIVEMASNSLKPTQYTARASDIRSLFDLGGEAISIQQHESPSMLEITRIVRDDVIHVELPDGGPNSRVLEIPQRGLHTPIGTFAIAAVWTVGRAPTIHFYNLETKELKTLQAPRELNSIRGFYYNPADGRIMMFGDTTNDIRRIYQIYGPETLN